MFLLETERGKYLKIRAGVKREEIIRTFQIPVDEELYEGKIIVLSEAKKYCFALAGDTYEKIAERNSLDVGELKKLNGEKQIYPTTRVWLS